MYVWHMSGQTYMYIHDACCVYIYKVNLECVCDVYIYICIYIYLYIYIYIYVYIYVYICIYACVCVNMMYARYGIHYDINHTDHTYHHLM